MADQKQMESDANSRQTNLAQKLKSVQQSDTMPTLSANKQDSASSDTEDVYYLKGNNNSLKTNQPIPQNKSEVEVRSNNSEVDEGERIAGKNDVFLLNQKQNLKESLKLICQGLSSSQDDEEVDGELEADFEADQISEGGKQGTIVMGSQQLGGVWHGADNEGGQLSGEEDDELDQMMLDADIELDDYDDHDDIDIDVDIEEEECGALEDDFQIELEDEDMQAGDDLDDGLVEGGYQCVTTSQYPFIACSKDDDTLEDKLEGKVRQRLNFDDQDDFIDKQFLQESISEDDYGIKQSSAKYNQPRTQKTNNVTEQQVDAQQEILPQISSIQPEIRMQQDENFLEEKLLPSPSRQESSELLDSNEKHQTSTQNSNQNLNEHLNHLRSVETDAKISETKSDSINRDLKSNQNSEMNHESKENLHVKAETQRTKSSVLGIKNDLQLLSFVQQEGILPIEVRSNASIKSLKATKLLLKSDRSKQSTQRSINFNMNRVCKLDTQTLRSALGDRLALKDLLPSQQASLQSKVQHLQMNNKSARDHKPKQDKLFSDDSRLAPETERVFSKGNDDDSDEDPRQLTLEKKGENGEEIRGNEVRSDESDNVDKVEQHDFLKFKMNLNFDYHDDFEEILDKEDNYSCRDGGDDEKLQGCAGLDLSLKSQKDDDEGKENKSSANQVVTIDKESDQIKEIQSLKANNLQNSKDNRRDKDSRLSIIRRNAEKLKEKRKESIYKECSLSRKQPNLNAKSKVQSFNLNYKKPKFLPPKPAKTINQSTGVKNKNTKKVKSTKKRKFGQNQSLTNKGSLKQQTYQKVQKITFDEPPISQNQVRKEQGNTKLIHSSSQKVLHQPLNIGAIHSKTSQNHPQFESKWTRNEPPSKVTTNQNLKSSLQNRQNQLVSRQLVRVASEQKLVDPKHKSTQNEQHICFQPKILNNSNSQKDLFLHPKEQLQIANSENNYQIMQDHDAAGKSNVKIKMQKDKILGDTSSVASYKSESLRLLAEKYKRGSPRVVVVQYGEMTEDKGDDLIRKVSASRNQDLTEDHGQHDNTNANVRIFNHDGDDKPQKPQCSALRSKQIHGKPPLKAMKPQPVNITAQEVRENNRLDNQELVLKAQLEKIESRLEQKKRELSRESVGSRRSLPPTTQPIKPIPSTRVKHFLGKPSELGNTDNSIVEKSISPEPTMPIDPVPNAQILSGYRQKRQMPHHASIEQSEHHNYLHKSPKSQSEGQKKSQTKKSPGEPSRMPARIQKHVKFCPSLNLVNPSSSSVPTSIAAEKGLDQSGHGQKKEGRVARVRERLDEEEEEDSDRRKKMEMERQGLEVQEERRGGEWDDVEMANEPTVSFVVGQQLDRGMVEPAVLLQPKLQEKEIVKGIDVYRANKKGEEQTQFESPRESRGSQSKVQSPSSLQNSRQVTFQPGTQQSDAVQFQILSANSNVKSDQKDQKDIIAKLDTRKNLPLKIPIIKPPDSNKPSAYQAFRVKVKKIDNQTKLGVESFAQRLGITANSEAANQERFQQELQAVELVPQNKRNIKDQNTRTERNSDTRARSSSSCLRLKDQRTSHTKTSCSDLRDSKQVKSPKNTLIPAVRDTQSSQGRRREYRAIVEKNTPSPQKIQKQISSSLRKKKSQFNQTFNTTVNTFYAQGPSKEPQNLKIENCQNAFFKSDLFKRLEQGSMTQTNINTRVNMINQATPSTSTYKTPVILFNPPQIQPNHQTIIPLQQRSKSHHHSSLSSKSQQSKHQISTQSLLTTKHASLCPPNQTIKPSKEPQKTKMNETSKINLQKESQECRQVINDLKALLLVRPPQLTNYQNQNNSDNSRQTTFKLDEQQQHENDTSQYFAQKKYSLVGRHLFENQASTSIGQSSLATISQHHHQNHHQMNHTLHHVNEQHHYRQLGIRTQLGHHQSRVRHCDHHHHHHHCSCSSINSTGHIGKGMKSRLFSHHDPQHRLDTSSATQINTSMRQPGKIVRKSNNNSTQRSVNNNQSKMVKEEEAWGRFQGDGNHGKLQDDWSSLERGVGRVGAEREVVDCRLAAEVQQIEQMILERQRARYDVKSVAATQKRQARSCAGQKKFSDERRKEVTEISRSQISDISKRSDNQRSMGDRKSVNSRQSGKNNRCQSRNSASQLSQNVNIGQWKRESYVDTSQQQDSMQFYMANQHQSSQIMENNIQQKSTDTELRTQLVLDKIQKLEPQLKQMRLQNQQAQEQIKKLMEMQDEIKEMGSSFGTQNPVTLSNSKSLHTLNNYSVPRFNLQTQTTLQHQKSAKQFQSLDSVEPTPFALGRKSQVISLINTETDGYMMSPFTRGSLVSNKYIDSDLQDQ